MVRTAVSLFSGVGFMDLGVQRAGVEIVAQVEIEEAAVRVLEARFPGVRRYRDVREVGAAHLPRADLIVGGFPCQDLSSANRNGAGLDGERSGLWGDYARIIGETRPRWTLIENVPGLLSRRKGADGRRVLGDLAALGYDAEWDVVSAAAVGAPHLRERVWIVAWDAARVRLPDPVGVDLREQRERLGEQRGEPRTAEPRADGAERGALADGDEARRPGFGAAHDDDGRDALGHDAHRRGADVADASSEPEREPADGADAFAGSREARALSGGGGVRERPFRIFDPESLAEWRARCEAEVWPRAEPGLRRVVDGRSGGVDERPVEPWERGVARAITKEEAAARRANGERRSHRLSGIGNGVVPQIAEFITRRIIAADKLFGGT